MKIRVPIHQEGGMKFCEVPSMTNPQRGGNANSPRGTDLCETSNESERLWPTEDTARSSQFGKEHTCELCGRSFMSPADHPGCASCGRIACKACSYWMDSCEACTRERDEDRGFRLASGTDSEIVCGECYHVDTCSCGGALEQERPFKNDFDEFRWKRRHPPEEVPPLFKDPFDRSEEEE